MANKEGNWFKRHKVLTAILVIIVIAVAASAAGGDSSNTKTNDQASAGSSDSKDKSQVAKIGQQVRDGKFEFTVKGIKCGEKSVGNEFLKTKAQGQFCRVSLTIKNIGDEAQTLDSTSQYAFNAQGQKYSSDDEAAIYAQSDDNSSTAWFDQINPGNTVKGDIFFDVPTGVKPVKLELHDSAFSGGVTVNLN